MLATKEEWTEVEKAAHAMLRLEATLLPRRLCDFPTRVTNYILPGSLTNRAEGWTDGQTDGRCVNLFTSQVKRIWATVPCRIALCWCDLSFFILCASKIVGWASVKKISDLCSVRLRAQACRTPQLPHRLPQTDPEEGRTSNWSQLATMICNACT